MNISKTCKLFLRDIYLYDITACHYSILKELNIDLSHIDKDDKTRRNYQIGLMMRDNPNLTTVLRNITDSTIDEYLMRNNIKESEIIIRQYDGIITTKRLRTTHRYIPLELKSVFDVFIISIDRKGYLSLSGNKVSIKGIPYRYEAMDGLYGKLVNINFLNKTSIFKSLQKIKDEVLYSKDPSLFCIPLSEDKVNIYIKQFGEIEMSRSLMKIMDTDDIDRHRYFDFYIRPFTESIVLEFI